MNESPFWEPEYFGEDGDYIVINVMGISRLQAAEKMKEFEDDLLGGDNKRTVQDYLDAIVAARCFYYPDPNKDESECWLLSQTRKVPPGYTEEIAVWAAFDIYP